MPSREDILRHLKVQGPSSVRQLVAATGLSANAVRHHLTRLAGERIVEEHDQRTGVGRPAHVYALTLAAEGAFPKRYPELLDAVLERAAARGLLLELLDDVAASLADGVKADLADLPPRARLLALMQRLDYGDMLGRLANTEGGWEFHAYNCVYRATGERFEPVCDLLPKVVHYATGMDAERVRCQRDGNRTCHFAGSYLSSGER
ncbi:MAG: ArsR family transcriptional regulator [Deinococcales bacterium]